MEEQQAYAYILNKFREGKEYDFLPEGALETMLRDIRALDGAFMEETGVAEDGAAYDDEQALEYLFAGMCEKHPEHKMYLMRFTEDYLDYNEDYLISIDAIEWD